MTPDDWLERREALAMTRKESNVQLNDLKTTVAQAGYVVDVRAVAEAMLRRAAEERAARLLVVAHPRLR